MLFLITDMFCKNIKNWFSSNMKRKIGGDMWMLYSIICQEKKIT